MCLNLTTPSLHQEQFLGAEFESYYTVTINVFCLQGLCKENTHIRGKMAGKNNQISFDTYILFTGLYIAVTRH